MTLAVSLHAPDDELRDTLVPMNNRWTVAEVLDAARYYADRTGRRVSIEYALIRDVNDQPWRADLLGRLLHKPRPLVHVNLIPLNPTPGSVWDASPKPVRARVRAPGDRAGRPVHGARHPRPGDRRGMRPARRRGCRADRPRSTRRSLAEEVDTVCEVEQTVCERHRGGSVTANSWAASTRCVT